MILIDLLGSQFSGKSTCLRYYFLLRVIDQIWLMFKKSHENLLFFLIKFFYFIAQIIQIKRVKKLTLDCSLKLTKIIFNPEKQLIVVATN